MLKTGPLVVKQLPWSVDFSFVHVFMFGYLVLGIYIHIVEKSSRSDPSPCCHLCPIMLRRPSLRDGIPSRSSTAITKLMFPLCEILLGRPPCLLFVTTKSHSKSSQKLFTLFALSLCTSKFDNDPICIRQLLSSGKSFPTLIESSLILKSHSSNFSMVSCIRHQFTWRASQTQI